MVREGKNRNHSGAISPLRIRRSDPSFSGPTTVEY